MATDFFDISYLAAGNERQRRCHEILKRTRIMEILSPHNPVLVGTTPIRIDIPASDLDIVCETGDAKAFARFMQENFRQYEDFNIHSLDETSVVCGFFEGGEEVQIYASPVESTQTNAYRHMIIEHRLLNILGPQFRDGIVSLKEQGMKTEPAFAWLLGLEGEPYTSILELEMYTDEQLAVLFAD